MSGILLPKVLPRILVGLQDVDDDVRSGGLKDQVDDGWHGVWREVAMDSLNVSPGPAMPDPLRPEGGPP
jgi:hypothetical protein